MTEATENPKKRVAVIGAGPSGLCVLYTLREYHGNEVELVCFERHAGVGGLWYYTDETGTDKYGIPVHCSMYRNLWLNNPKEAFEWYHFQFPEDSPSFVHRDVMYNYIKGYAEKFELLKFVNFETYVEQVVYDEDNQKFNLTSKYLQNQEGKTEQFDYIVVCTGHLSTPNVPKFPGIESFTGQVLHSHDFRKPEEYAGKQVLCIGGSYSAEDVALQCFKYGAKHVTISYKTKPMNFKWPDNIEERPLLTNINGSKVEFSNGTSEDYDAIILCTGYLHSFPFMAENIRLIIGNRMAPPLYKQIVLPENPSVFYIGMQNQAYTLTMFHLQALFVRDVLLGKINLPDKNGMLKEIKEQQDTEATLGDIEAMVGFQSSYVDDLAAVTKSQCQCDKALARADPYKK